MHTRPKTKGTPTLNEGMVNQCCTFETNKSSVNKNKGLYNLSNPLQESYPTELSTTKWNFSPWVCSLVVVTYGNEPAGPEFEPLLYFSVGYMKGPISLMFFFTNSWDRCLTVMVDSLLSKQKTKKKGPKQRTKEILE